MTERQLNYPQRKRSPDNAKHTTPTRDLNAVARVTLALQLKAAGKTYDEIAAQAGYGSRGAAHKAVMREMQRNISPKVEEVREEEYHMLSVLHRKVWEIFDSPKVVPAVRVQAANTIIAISERKSKLYGADVPVDNALMSNITIVREVPAGLLSVVEQGQ